MNKYFRQRLLFLKKDDLDKEKILSYRKELIICMKSMGATEEEINLIHDVIIQNSIRNNRKPEDVAWAILQ